MIDVLIAGGGPAGLAAGIHAARAGLRAVVVEPRTTPVDKACGEGIMPGGVAALRAMGIAVSGLSGRDLRGIRYRDGVQDAEARFRDGTGRGVRRTELHAALRRRADALGVETVRGKIGEVRQSADRVYAGGRTARWLIAADGLHSPIRRGLGLELRDRAPSRYGLRRHFRVEPWSDFVEVHWARHGEAYVTPVGDDLVGVAVLSRERRGYAEHLARFPDLAPLLGERPASAVRGAGPLRQRVSSPLAGRVLLVGDAAGYVDALTGEGVALALSTAEAAVRALAQDRPGTYPAAWAKLTRRHRLLTEGLLYATRRPGGARLIVPAAARLPSVFAAAVHALQ
ncbi:NAD(P)/FAD-dependent oxidoreductase [Streptomyces sp. NPDC058653]|uniref:NAD(P)/FAD-dependent oxidoreductase n=1 Tax=Streptomyces sp. NPDC058653 TaxID=3346576 RepID=UPI0036567BF4